MKMAANQATSPGKETKTAGPATRAGTRGKKAAAGKASFADLVAGMAGSTGCPDQTTAADHRSGGHYLTVNRPGPPGQTRMMRRVTRGCQVPDQPFGGGPGRPGQIVHAGVPEAPMLDGKGTRFPTGSNTAAETTGHSLSGMAAPVRRTGSAATEGRTAELGRGSVTSSPEEPGTLLRRLPVAGAQQMPAGRPEPGQDHRPFRADAPGVENLAAARDGADKPLPGTNPPGQEARTAAADTGVTNPPVGTDASRMAETTTPVLQAAAPERTGLSLTQMDALMERMVELIKSAPASLQVRLKPEILGNINILVESSEGAITISISAQNTDTASMLSNNLASMRNYLEQQGINLRQMEVNPGYQEDRSQADGHRPRGSGNGAGNRAAPEEAAISGDQMVRGRGNRPGLNILA